MILLRAVPLGEYQAGLDVVYETKDEDKMLESSKKIAIKIKYLNLHIYLMLIKNLLFEFKLGCYISMLNT